MLGPNEGGQTMRTMLPTRLETALLAVPVLLAGAIVAAVLLTDNSEFLTPVTVIAAVFMVLVFIAGLAGAFRRFVAPARVNQTLAVFARAREIELVPEVTPPPRPMVATAVRVQGICPLQLMAGDRWRIDKSGAVAPVVCRPAAAAMDRLLQGRQLPRGAEIACVCPLGPQRIAFEVSAA